MEAPTAHGCKNGCTNKWQEMTHLFTILLNEPGWEQLTVHILYTSELPSPH
jgi:hypothetical protein